MDDIRFPSEGPSIPRSHFPSPTRHRYTSESPSLPRSRRPSSARSSSIYSLASSDGEERFGRRGTADYDGRTRPRVVRPSEAREGSTAAPMPTASLPPLPTILLDSSSEVTSIIGGLYVEDIDAEEGEGDKDKEEFERDCLTIVLQQMFGEPGMADRISKDLGMFTLKWETGD
jgi:hypothetical protein